MARTMGCCIRSAIERHKGKYIAAGVTGAIAGGALGGKSALAALAAYKASKGFCVLCAAEVVGLELLLIQIYVCLY